MNTNILDKLAHSLGRRDEAPNQELANAIVQSMDNKAVRAMYAENALQVINSGNKKDFISTLTSRINGIEKESKRSRIEKVVSKVNKM